MPKSVSTGDPTRYCCVCHGFSPASQNAGLYASAVSVRFGTTLVVAHAFTLTQAALEAETEEPLASQQRRNLNHDLALTAEILDSREGNNRNCSARRRPLPSDPGVFEE